MDMKSLFEEARDAAMRSYSPYSKFRVGAALLCADGSVIHGTNVENRSFGLTICAERSAIVTAISLGKRDFTAIAICTPDSLYAVSPCGACRQVLTEFLPGDAEVLFGPELAKSENCTISDLFPYDALHELGKSGSAQ